MCRQVELTDGKSRRKFEGMSKKKKKQKLKVAKRELKKCRAEIAAQEDVVTKAEGALEKQRKKLEKQRKKEERLLSKMDAIKGKPKDAGKNDAQPESADESVPQINYGQMLTEKIEAAKEQLAQAKAG